ncbi:HSP18 transcriptional regulator [Streptomyces sp. NPDC048257]|uniref:HSP18 transcriptional regulator n=1 Tax=Streptomyces sp. NPDC048257 TaxID=3365526 RepID=UPI00372213D7
MTSVQPTQPPHPGPASFVAAAAALHTIDQALRDAQRAHPEHRTAPSHDGPHPALASLLLLRHVREQLADWESGLIETAREAGASWADLAEPLGVASRQAAERRYLRLRPGSAGDTGEQRVQAVRDRRAADRTVTAWARDNAAALRRLAGQITALTDLPATADRQLGELNQALAHHDAAHLVRPLTDSRSHLQPEHPELVDRIDEMTRHTDQLREDSNQQRSRP